MTTVAPPKDYKRYTSAVFKEINQRETHTLDSIKESDKEFHWTKIAHEKTSDTVLHVAARLGYHEIIQRLLQGDQAAKFVNCKNNHDKTALHEAAQFAQYKCCEVLLKHGALVNALKKADWTPLMLACTNIKPELSYETVRTIASHAKCVFNYRNIDGWTAGHLICREGDLEILKLLVEKGLDMSLETRNGRTCLHIASLHGHTEIVAYLLTFGEVFDVNVKDTSGSTPLHEAVLGGHLSTCKFLIENKADVKCMNKAGFNLLHLAASQEENEQNMELLEFLLNDLHISINQTTYFKSQYTPLHCAAKKNNLAIYEFLIKNGCDVNIKDYGGRVAKEMFPK